MFNLLYRFRALTALFVAVAIGATAIALGSATAGNFGRVTFHAATPACDGSQNPFLD
jgi:hypothetical protein